MIDLDRFLPPGLRGLGPNIAVPLTMQLTDQSIGLVNNLPQLVQQMLAAKMGPVAGQLAMPFINNAIGMGLDALTGTGDSDLPYSDRVGKSYTQAQRTRAANRARRSFNDAYNISAEATRATEQRASDDTEAVLKQIYGEQYDRRMLDSWGSSLLTGWNRTARREAYNAGVSAIRNARFTNADIYAFTSGATTDPAQAAKNQAEFVNRIADEIQAAMYGKDGKASITKTLSVGEVQSIVEDYTSRGGFSSKDTDKNVESMRDYLSKIAEGVDNIKQVMGDNFSADQAKKLVREVTGTSGAFRNTEAFTTLTNQFKQLAFSRGVDHQDWKEGTVLASKALAGYGSSSFLNSVVGLQAAGASARSTNVRVGKSDAEHQRDIVELGADAVLSGATNNVAAAMTVAQMLGGKRDGALYQDKLFKLLTASRGKNLGDQGAMIRAVAEATGQDIGTVRRMFANSYNLDATEANKAKAQEFAAQWRSIEATESLEKDSQKLFEQYTGMSSEDGKKLLNIEGDWARLSQKDILERLAKLSDDELQPYGGRAKVADNISKFLNAQQQDSRYEKVQAHYAYVDRKRDAEMANGDRYQRGIRGIVQRISNRDEELSVKEIISVALSGESGAFNNEAVIKTISDSLTGETREKALKKLDKEAIERINKVKNSRKDYKTEDDYIKAVREAEDSEILGAELKKIEKQAGEKLKLVGETIGEAFGAITGGNDNGAAAAELKKAADALSDAAKALKDGKITLHAEAASVFATAVAKKLDEMARVYAEELAKRKQG
jgi:hypothetical protein